MRGLRSDAGQAAAEFIMLFPFMMLLVLFFIEFGIALHSWILINNAAAEAARFAAVGNLPTDVAGTCPGGFLSVEERAVQASNNNITCADVTVAYERFSGSTVQRGDGVNVRITHTYQTVTGFADILNFVTAGIVPSTWTMSSCADARLETRPTRSPLPDGLNCG